MSGLISRSMIHMCNVPYMHGPRGELWAWENPEEELKWKWTVPMCQPYCSVTTTVSRSPQDNNRHSWLCPVTSLSDSVTLSLSVGDPGGESLPVQCQVTGALPWASWSWEVKKCRKLLPRWRWICGESLSLPWGCTRQCPSMRLPLSFPLAILKDQRKQRADCSQPTTWNSNGWFLLPCPGQDSTADK